MVTFLTFLLIALAMLFPVVVIVRIGEKKEEKELQKAREKAEALRNQKIAEAKAGTWEFPTDRFYDECAKQNITKVSDDFCVKKMVLIAKKIIQDEQIPLECAKQYYSDESVKEYYIKAKKEKEIAIKKQKDKELLERKTPQKAEFTPYIEREALLHEELKNLTFSQKRERHIRLLMQECRIRLSEEEKRINNAALLSDAIIASSQMPKNDWATLGGIAQGIAGPGAGAVVAGQAIAENQRIEQQNRVNLAYASNIASNISRASSVSHRAKGTLEEKIAFYEKELKDLPFKVFFLESDTQELFEHLKISGRIDSSAPKNICANIYVESNYTSEVSKEHKIVIDGILRVKLFCEDVFVDEFHVALPEYGIESGIRETIKQYPKKYMIGENRKYNFEFYPHKLWLMEQ